MTSNRPYLLRTLYEWIVDNNCTPHILVDATRAGVQVPEAHVQDGRIVLNVAPEAVQGLSMDNHSVEFHARFSGVSQQLLIPVHAVLAIYARENGQGMMFPDEPEPEPPVEAAPDNNTTGSPAASSPRPTLKVIK